MEKVERILSSKNRLFLSWTSRVQARVIGLKLVQVQWRPQFKLFHMLARHDTHTIWTMGLHVPSSMAMQHVAYWGTYKMDHNIAYAIPDKKRNKPCDESSLLTGKCIWLTRFLLNWSADSPSADKWLHLRLPEVFLRIDLPESLV